MHTRNPFPIVAAVFTLVVLALAVEPTKEQLDFLEGRIRPLPADRCYTSHSLESGKHKGGLTLDTMDAGRKGGDTGPAVGPGDVDHSIIYKAVTKTDNDLQMRRRHFESFRDSLLVLSGRLDPRIAGQPVKITEVPYRYRRSMVG